MTSLVAFVLTLVVGTWWVRHALDEWFATLCRRDDLELPSRPGDILVVMLAAWPLYWSRRRYEERREAGR